MKNKVVFKCSEEEFHSIIQTFTKAMSYLDTTHSQMYDLDSIDETSAKYYLMRRELHGMARRLMINLLDKLLEKSIFDNVVACNFNNDIIIRQDKFTIKIGEWSDDCKIYDTFVLIMASFFDNAISKLIEEKEKNENGNNENKGQTL